jgi:hypothetical protein
MNTTEITLTAEVIAEAQAIGAAWGAEEASLWRDQHESSDLPEWTNGTYCGEIPNDPGPADEDYRHEYRNAVERVIDAAAKAAWDAAKEGE